MIITCNKCSKKFNVNSDLIPEKGRLLQCSSCDHKWFFTLSNQDSFKELSTPKKTPVIENDSTTDIENKSDLKDDIGIIQKKILENNTNVVSVKKDFKILSKIFVFIISFVAFVIVLDTFKSPISKVSFIEPDGIQ